MIQDQMELEKIDALAAEYRGQGYAVRVQPPVGEMPPFLRDFTPDLIATSPAGNIVVQVKSSRHFDPEQARKLVEVLQGQPKWRFEQVFVSPPVAPDVPAQEELAGDEQVTQMLEDAETLSSQGHPDAAGLIAWSAVEAILRRYAQTAAPDLERQSSARVLKQLYSRGLVQPEVYENLWRLLEFRNALSHGFQPRTTAPSISEIIGDIRRLQHAA